MKAGMKFALAWLGATVVAVLVAAAAVGSVRSEVTDEPTRLGSPEIAAMSADVPATQPVTSSSTSTLPVVDVTSTAPETEPLPTTTTTTTTVAETTPTIAAPTTTVGSAPEPPPAPTTTTTTTEPSTTTTTEPAESYSKTYDTVGGSVRVIVEGASVTFGGAVPKAGWSVELEKPGPKEVKVEFDENEGEGEVEFSAKIEDGELTVEISQDDHDE